MTAIWARARNALLDILSAHGLAGIHIEMYDLNRIFVPWLLPLSSKDKTLRHHDTKRAEIPRCCQEIVEQRRDRDVRRERILIDDGRYFNTIINRKRQHAYADAEDIICVYSQPKVIHSNPIS